MLSSLGSALLGLLARGAYSGYDLLQLMQRPVSLFWYANHSQIYTELTRLEAQGYVTHQLIVQKDKPDKKVYSITDQGLMALREWTIQPLGKIEVRDEFLLKVFSLWLIDRDSAINLFEGQLAKLTKIQVSLEQMMNNLKQESGCELKIRTFPAFSQYILLERSIRRNHEYLSWCEWVIELLQNDNLE